MHILPDNNIPSFKTKGTWSIKSRTRENIFLSNRMYYDQQLGSVIKLQPHNINTAQMSFLAD